MDEKYPQPNGLTDSKAKTPIHKIKQAKKKHPTNNASFLRDHFDVDADKLNSNLMLQDVGRNGISKKHMHLTIELHSAKMMETVIMIHYLKINAKIKVPNIVYMARKLVTKCEICNQFWS
ncbi:hypothetical protein CHS0354_005943 [Potamilus streckersoni]|uniref:Uncharacterized protein n=1 Tax=Potamilus streckersoni TaxID=2493646 RepID=A0AAE0VZK8_9BIVA|nr:hypothetical protein CHS0354_005943 [Potamilus streckersoni]